jgi:hypothetical protein
MEPFEYMELDSVALEAYIKEVSESLAEALKGGSKDYKRATQLYSKLKHACSWAKISLLDTFFKLGVSKATPLTADARQKMIERARALRNKVKVRLPIRPSISPGFAPIPKEFLSKGLVQASAEWIGAVGQAGGKIAGRAAGPLGAIILIKDAHAATNHIAEKCAKANLTREIAAYGDYLHEVESGKSKFLTFTQWKTEYIIKDRLVQRSEFFKQLDALMPHKPWK